MRRTIRTLAFSLLVIGAVACGGGGGTSVSTTTGTTESRPTATTTAPTATTGGATAQQPTAIATPVPSQAAQPTVAPSPTAKPQAVTIVSQGFGQDPDGRQVGWAFMVENPNPGLAVESSKYQIAFSDDSGTIIETDSGYIELLMPSEKTAISGLAILPEGAKASKMDVTFSQGDMASLDVNAKFTTDKVTYFADKYRPIVTGNRHQHICQDAARHPSLSRRLRREQQNHRQRLHLSSTSSQPAGSTGVSMSVTSSADPDHVELYASISGLTTLAAGTSAPDTGQPLAVSKQGFGQSSTLGQVGWAFVVENPNTSQTFEDSLYQVAAYDEGGTVIGTADGYINLLVASEKLGFGGNFSLPDGKTTARIEVQVLKGNLSKLTVTQLFSTESVKYVADQYSPKITGVVKNLTDKTLENIRVSAIAYNDAGDIIGGGYTYLDFVPANAQSAAEVRITATGVPTKVELYPTITSLTTFAP